MTISQIHNHRLVLVGLRIITVLMFAAVFYASCVPTISPPSITHMDKVTHLAVYFILTVASWAAWPNLRKTLLFWVCVLYGALIEVVQTVMNLGRTGSILDGLANATGAALGLLLIVVMGHLWKRHKP